LATKRDTGGDLGILMKRILFVAVRRGTEAGRGEGQFPAQESKREVAEHLYSLDLQPEWRARGTRYNVLNETPFL
jgi:hypothetical protein